MTKATFSIAKDIFDRIHETEVFGAGVREENKERTEDLNNQKITAYSGLIASIAGVTLVKGNLPKYARDKVWNGLTQDAGVTKAVAKKYLENSVGAVRELDIPTQATGMAVKQILLDEDITSEAKLAKRVKAEADDSPEGRVCRDFVGGFTTRKDDNGNRVPGVFKLGKHTDEADPFAALERLRSALDEAERIARAAIEAAAAAEEERASYEEVMNALDAA